MKTFLAILIISVVGLSTYAQTDSTQTSTDFKDLIEKTETVEKAEKIKKGDKIGKKEEKTDTVQVRIGKHNVEIVSEGDKTSIDVEKIEDFKSKWDDADKKSHKEYKTVHKTKKKRKRKFDGHWSSFDFGGNMFISPAEGTMFTGFGEVDYTGYPEGSNFMDIRPEKSFEFNFNFAEYSFGFGSYVGFVTGLGLNWNNYRFADKITIENVDGKIQPKAIPEDDFRKSKFGTTYLHAPMLLEFQIPGNHGSDRLFIAGGLIGGVKLGEKTKYKAGGSKYKDKGSFNSSPLRWGYTARVGFEDFGIYATYYNTKMFEDGTGPAMQPITIGVTLTFD